MHFSHMVTKKFTGTQNFQTNCEGEIYIHGENMKATGNCDGDISKLDK